MDEWTNDWTNEWTNEPNERTSEGPCRSEQYILPAYVLMSSLKAEGKTQEIFSDIAPRGGRVSEVRREHRRPFHTSFVRVIRLTRLIRDC